MPSYFGNRQNGGIYPINDVYIMYCNAIALRKHANNILLVDHSFQSCDIDSIKKRKNDWYIIRINYQSEWNFLEGMFVMFCAYSLEKSKWILLFCIILLRYW